MLGVVAGVLAQVEEPLVRWGWLGDHVDVIVQRTVQHIQLTAVSLGLGLAVSMVLASVIRRWRWTTTPILGLTTLLYAVPSIAMFAALLPLFGIGLTVPTVVLTTYSLVVLTPFLVDAFDGVPPDAVDAASGLGFTRLQRLWRIELPLAVPTIVGGVRIASVTLIGLVTVGGLFDLGGFGNLIDDGLGRDFPTLIVVGAAGSVLLAVVADLLLVGVGRTLTRWRR
jgi:osmoprotectant transport system permease protein